MSVGWTDERVELLRVRWVEGLTATQIANELDCGISRSAICGKVHRLKLEKRHKASLPRKPRPPRSDRNSQHVMSSINARMRRPPVFKAEPMPEPEVLEVILDEATILAQRCTLMDLTKTTCRFPSGDPGTEEFFFCGGKTWRDSPYCRAHCRVAYMPAPERRKEKPMPPVYVGSMERRWATV